MMERALVTGGGGFLGSALVRRLLDQGCTVKVAGRHRYEQVERWGARCLVGDIGDKDFTARACRDIEGSWLHKQPPTKARCLKG